MTFFEQVKKFEDLYGDSRSLFVGNDNIIIVGKSRNREYNPHLFIKDCTRIFLYHMDDIKGTWAECYGWDWESTNWNWEWNWVRSANIPQTIASFVKEEDLTEFLFSEHETIREMALIILRAKQSLKLP